MLLKDLTDLFALIFFLLLTSYFKIITFFRYWVFSSGDGLQFFTSFLRVDSDLSASNYVSISILSKEEMFKTRF